MATVAYRPELENPQRDGSISFAVMDPEKKSMTTLTLDPGVNRKIDDQKWSKLRDTSSVKALVRIGAIEELMPKEQSDDEAEQPDIQAAGELSDVLGLAIPDAVKVIEASFDESFLGRWKVAEGRSTVINKINQRLRQLKAGEG